MNKYIFVFGRNPELSYAELISFFKNHKINYKLEYNYENAAVFVIENFNLDISKLGGTVKIAEVILENKVEELDFYTGSKNKINYGISVYGKSNLLNKFELTLKKWF